MGQLKQPKKHILKKWLVLIIIVVLCGEALSYLGLLVLKFKNIKYAPVNILSEPHRSILLNIVQKKAAYLDYSSKLGWTVKPNTNLPLIKTNSSGIRSEFNYSLISGEGVIRMATFGNSFTHGDEVSNMDTWQSYMEKLDSNLQVLNFGVPGYGLDQAYLRYLEDGVPYHPEWVIIGFMSGNIFRNVNTYRPFYVAETGIPMAKPRFTIKQNQLVLIPNLIPIRDGYNSLLTDPKKEFSRLGSQDYFYSSRFKDNVFDFLRVTRLFKVTATRYGDWRRRNSIYKNASEPLLVTQKIFDAFYQKSIENNSRPIIVLFPNKGDLQRYKKDGTKWYAPLLTYFKTRNYRHIDLMEAFEKDSAYGLKEIFGALHYSPLGNNLAAHHILSSLNKYGYPKNKN